MATKSAASLVIVSSMPHRDFSETTGMDERENAPSAERNKGPILDVVRRVLPARGVVLEFGSGTGQHVAHFAAALPSLAFQPSELDTARHPSIRAWTRELANVRRPIELDVTRLPW